MTHWIWRCCVFLVEDVYTLYRLPKWNYSNSTLLIIFEEPLPWAQAPCLKRGGGESMLKPRGHGRQHPLHRLQEGASLHPVGRKRGASSFLKKVIFCRGHRELQDRVLETRGLGQKLQPLNAQWPQGHRVLGHGKAMVLVVEIPQNPSSLW